jgi:hypothetical protein
VVNDCQGRGRGQQARVKVMAQVFLPEATATLGSRKNSSKFPYPGPQGAGWRKGSGE